MFRVCAGVFLSLLAVGLSATFGLVPLGATSASAVEWHDTLFDRTVRLEPDGQRILVEFEVPTAPVAFDQVAARYGLSVSTSGTPAAVSRFHLFEAPSVTSSLLGELQDDSGVAGATPAMIDEDGFTKLYVDGVVLVQFRDDLSEAEIDAAIADLGSEILEDRWTPGLYKVAAPRGLDLFSAIPAWYASGLVLYAEPVYVHIDDRLGADPDDPLFLDQWALRNPGGGSWKLTADVRADAAWWIDSGDPDVVIAFVDTGVDLGHEDLVGNLLPRGSEDWDFTAGADAIPDDVLNHGTAVTGIASAVRNNGIGIAGLSPGTRFMPLKVSLTDGDHVSRIDAINYAASRRTEHSALIVNCSWQTSAGDITGVHAAIQNAHDQGCIIVCAAGNAAGDVVYPARYPETIAVGATTMCDERKRVGSCDGEGWASSYGSQLDVVAPGVKMYTTDRTGNLGYTTSNYFNAYNGTSSAAPVVSAICALIASAAPDWSNEEVRQILHDSADDEVGYWLEDDPGFDIYMGYGRVNAYRALLIAKESYGVEDDLESGAPGWQHEAIFLGPDPWHLDDRRNATPGGAWSFNSAHEESGLYEPGIDAALYLPDLIVPLDAQLTFEHAMDLFELEPGVAGDGGFLEISSDGGESWLALVPESGYTHEWGTHDSDPYPTATPVFSGNFDWRSETIDLSGHAGETARIRFRFGTRSTIDEGEFGEGWFIDDVRIAPLDTSGIERSMSRPPSKRIESATVLNNPFHGHARLEFTLSHVSEVVVRVLSVRGAELHTRHLGRVPSGQHIHTWDGRSDRGELLPSGIYFLRLEAGSDVVRRRLVLLR